MPYEKENAVPKREPKQKSVLLAGMLVSHLASKDPCRPIPKDDRDWEVRGPMHINGDAFPFHLYRHEKDDEDGCERELRIAVDPYRKFNGKPLKGSGKPQPVYAVMYIRLTSPGGQGNDDVLTIDFGMVESIMSVVKCDGG
ncbi:MAG: hypothetical protein QG650_417 [Patescibacteria group bacterium]|nr:hypothetical protein [Patescibacteria group bacterium]